VPCFSISSFRPFLPIPVCFGPRIAISVPIGSVVLVLGTNVTLVWSPKDFVNVTPCFALLPTVQPALCKRLINCLPEGAQAIRTSINHCGHFLNMRAIVYFSSPRGGDSNFIFRFCAMESYRMLSEESLSLSHILKRIEVKQYGFLKFSRSFWYRATECGRAEFLTASYPSSTFFVELESNTNITFCWHGLSSLSSGVVFNAFNMPNIYYTTIRQWVNAKMNRLYEVTVLTIALYAWSNLSAIVLNNVSQFTFVGIGLQRAHSQARSIMRIRSSDSIFNYLLQRMVTMIITPRRVMSIVHCLTREYSNQV